MATFTRVMPAVRGDIRQSATWSIVLSVLMIVSGVLAIAIPSIAGLAVTVTLGWLLILTAALHVGLAWRGEGATARMGEVLVAVGYAAAGGEMLARPVAGLASLTLVIAAYLVVKAGLEGMVAFQLRPLPGTGWLLFDAIVTVMVASMIASAWPASTGWAVGLLAGIAMVSSGFARLMVSATVRRLVA